MLATFLFAPPLSPFLLPLLQVCNVHGVRAEFLAIGASTRTRPAGAYFLGKAMYTKGYRELIDALNAYHNAGGGDGVMGAGNGDALPPIDTFGSGADESAIRAEVAAAGLPVTVHKVGSATRPLGNLHRTVASHQSDSPCHPRLS